jgi:hypothetical protein
MTDSQALAQISRAEVALDATTDIGEIKGLYDLAEAYRSYAKSAEEQNLAATFKIHAAAKGGALLAANPELASRKKVTDSLSVTFPGLTSTAARTLAPVKVTACHLPSPASPQPRPEHRPRQS